MVLIHTERFEFSHGKLPRGRAWAFETRDGTVVLWFNGTYRDAVKWARQLKFAEVWVSP